MVDSSPVVDGFVGNRFAGGTQECSYSGRPAEGVDHFTGCGEMLHVGNLSVDFRQVKSEKFGWRPKSSDHTVRRMPTTENYTEEDIQEGRRLKAIRYLDGFGGRQQSKYAAHLGISKKTYSGYEKGSGIPKHVIKQVTLAHPGMQTDFIMLGRVDYLPSFMKTKLEAHLAAFEAGDGFAEAVAVPGLDAAPARASAKRRA